MHQTWCNVSFLTLLFTGPLGKSNVRHSILLLVFIVTIRITCTCQQWRRAPHHTSRCNKRAIVTPPKTNTYCYHLQTLTAENDNSILTPSSLFLLTSCLHIWSTSRVAFDPTWQSYARYQRYQLVPHTQLVPRNQYQVQPDMICTYDLLSLHYLFLLNDSIPVPRWKDIIDIILPLIKQYLFSINTILVWWLH